MATRGELTSYVLERLGVSSSRTAFADGVRAQLYRRYVALAGRFEFSIDVANLAFVADDPFVDLPDDWLKTRTIRRTDALSPLLEVTMETLAGQRGITATSGSDGQSPSRYVFMPPSRIYLDVVPSTSNAAGAEIVYVVKPTAWTTDTDTPSLMPEEYHDLLAEETIVRYAMNQEEFAGHAQGALQAAGILTGELQAYLKMRSGDGSNHIQRRHYG